MERRIIDAAEVTALHPMDILLLFGSLIVLVFGAEVLVRGASGLAIRLAVSSFFIGLTIVGFGTSTPELATSVVAAIQDFDDIAVGNVLGSNIFNIAMVLGVTAVIAPVAVKLHMVRQEVVIVLLVSLVPFAAWLTGGVLPRWMGAALLLGLVAYVYRGYRLGRREGVDDDPSLRRKLDDVTPIPATRWTTSWAVQIAFILAGLALLVIGSSMLVDASVSIARKMGISELVIGLTVVAVGTSAPELFTSLVATVRRQGDIAVGNILGSNIFNILGILGLTCLVQPQVLKQQTLWLDLPFMVLLSAACIPIMASGGKISRGEGGALVAVYVGYIVLLLTAAPGWFAG